MSTSACGYNGHMEYASLETAALAHVDDSYYYGAYCRKCKHSAQLSLVKLQAHLWRFVPPSKRRIGCAASDAVREPSSSRFSRRTSGSVTLHTCLTCRLSNYSGRSTRRRHSRSFPSELESA